jgi:hypothetical protein
MFIIHHIHHIFSLFYFGKMIVIYINGSQWEPCHIMEGPQAKVGKMGGAMEIVKWTMKISLLK